MNSNELLKRIFGYEEFYPGQKVIIDGIIGGKRKGESEEQEWKTIYRNKRTNKCLEHIV